MMLMNSEEPDSDAPHDLNNMMSDDPFSKDKGKTHHQLDPKTKLVLSIKNNPYAKNFLPTLTREDLTLVQNTLATPMYAKMQGVLKGAASPKDTARVLFACLCASGYLHDDTLDPTTLCQALAEGGVNSKVFAGNLKHGITSLNKNTDLDAWGKVLFRPELAADIDDLCRELVEKSRSGFVDYLRHVFLPSQFPFVFPPMNSLYPMVHFTNDVALTIAVPPSNGTTAVNTTVQIVFMPYAIFGPILMVLVGYSDNTARPPTISYPFCASFPEMANWVFASGEIVVFDKTPVLNQGGTISIGYDVKNYNNAASNQFVGNKHFTNPTDQQAFKAAYPNAPDAQNGNWSGWPGVNNEANFFEWTRVKTADGAVRASVLPLQSKDMDMVDINSTATFSGQPAINIIFDGVTPGASLDVKVKANYVGNVALNYRQKYGSNPVTLARTSTPMDAVTAVQMLKGKSLDRVAFPVSDSGIVKQDIMQESAKVAKQVGQGSASAMDSIVKFIGKASQYIPSVVSGIEKYAPKVMALLG